MKTTPITKAPRLSVASVKTFKGREGYGINANLYFDGKKRAEVIDSGKG